MCWITGYATFGGPPPDRGVLDRMCARLMHRGPDEGRFHVEEVDRPKGEHLEGRENHGVLPWALMVYQNWRDRWAA